MKLKSLPAILAFSVTALLADEPRFASQQSATNALHIFLTAFEMQDSERAAASTLPETLRYMRLERTELATIYRRLFEMRTSRMLLSKGFQADAPGYFKTTSDQDAYLFHVREHIDSFDGEIWEERKVLLVTVGQSHEWSVLYLDCLSEDHLRVILPGYKSQLQQFF